MLSSSYLTTIELYACGMKGCMPSGERLYTRDEVTAIEATARMQGVWPVVFAVLKKLAAEGRAEIEGGMLSKWQMEMNMKVMQYTMRQEAMYQFLENELSFCHPVMLKGELMSDLYANPELRMSGDTDLLIDIKDENEVLQAFVKAGGEYKKRSENNNQSVCVHPRAGVFEIHISLDTKEVSEVWYDNLDFGAEEKRQVVLKNGHTVTALGITDGAINMVLHVFKHLIGGIAHLKMLGDALLYLSHYDKEIDKTRLCAVMEQLGYTKVYETILTIGKSYFGFESLDGKEEYASLAEKFLFDLQFCAEHQFDEEKLNVYNEYSRRRYENYHGKNYGEYKARLMRREFFGRLFPGKTKLYQDYPILVKCGWVLPFVWVMRILKKLFGKKEAVQSQTALRLALLKELDIL